MNKQLFSYTIRAIGIIALAIGFANHGFAKGGDDMLKPMFVLGYNQGYLQAVYWTDFTEPSREDWDQKYYEGALKSWDYQEILRHNASKYTKLIVDGTKTRDVKYVDEILLNPDGEPLYPGELHGRPQIPSPGARYALLGEPMTDGIFPGVVIVTDKYLSKHKAMSIEAVESDGDKPLPASIVKQMEQKYGMEAERSDMGFIIDGRYTYGVIQFKGEYNNPDKNKDPYIKSALALEVISDGNKVYSYPVVGWYYPDEGPTWNADDGGEYFTSDIAAAFDGKEGPEFYFVRSAPESATTGRFFFKGGELQREQYAMYHCLIDEEIPVWKKDIEEMKRQYVAEDPHENKNVELTKWAHAWIDYEGEQLWISDQDEENGAFFTREDGQLKLITTVRAGLKPSFADGNNGDSYLILSGHSGGPSYYYEIFKFMGGKVVEKFVAIYVYGEIESCYLNDEEISVEQGEAYMETLPESSESYIGWNDIYQSDIAE